MGRNVRPIFAAWAAAALLFLAGAQKASFAQSDAESPADEPEIVVETETGVDAQGHVTAPVRVNGQGPFRFFVDTGANRSAVSSRLATRLGLRQENTGRVHGLAGAVMAPLARVNSLQSGAIDLDGVELPVLPEVGFGGAVAGVLGIEALAGRRLTIDFVQRTMRIARASRRAPGAEWSSVRARFRLGRLVVTRGVIDGVDVNVIIDTGAHTSFGNTPFAETLTQAGANRVRRFEIVEAAFGPDIVVSQLLLVSSMRLGDLEAQNFPVLISDLHIFNIWELQSEPTILLGMDIISQARALAIDYEYARLYFLPRREDVRR